MSVHLIAPWYTYYPILCDSLRLQTRQDWTLDLIHDGPEQRPKRKGEWRKDDRIEVMNTAKRYNDWGHSLRALALESLPEPRPDYIVITNADNYYAPTFLALMLDAVQGHDGAYCDCVHSHAEWNWFPCRVEMSQIDCGCVLVRTDLAVQAGWHSREFAADWVWINSMLEISRDFIHVPKPLFVHC